MLKLKTYYRERRPNTSVLCNYLEKKRRILKAIFPDKEIFEVIGANPCGSVYADEEGLNLYIELTRQEEQLVRQLKSVSALYDAPPDAELPFMAFYLGPNSLSLISDHDGLNDQDQFDEELMLYYLAK